MSLLFSFSYFFSYKRLHFTSIGVKCHIRTTIRNKTFWDWFKYPLRPHLKNGWMLLNTRIAFKQLKTSNMRWLIWWKLEQRIKVCNDGLLLITQSIVSICVCCPRDTISSDFYLQAPISCCLIVGLDVKRKVF